MHFENYTLQLTSVPPLVEHRWGTSFSEVGDTQILCGAQGPHRQNNTLEVVLTCGPHEQEPVKLTWCKESNEEVGITQVCK